MDIPAPELATPISAIPSNAAEIAQNIEAPEATPLLISFARYNAKECEIETMEAKQGRKALRALRDIGMLITSQVDFKSKLPKLEIEPVIDTGDYRCLFRHLRDIPDIEMYEAKLDADKSRLFYFIIDKVLNIVAVRGSHYETDKQRR